MFKAGVVSAVALFGLAWLTDTFIGAWETEIVNVVGGWVTAFSAIFFFGVFLVAALTTSQSTATRTIVPIGLAAGLAPAVISGMWAGAFAGVFTLPTNGSQIAAANFDETGTTKLGTKLIDHSFFVPMVAPRRVSPQPSAQSSARSSTERYPMNDQELLSYVGDAWDRDVVPDALGLHPHPQCVARVRGRLGDPRPHAARRAAARSGGARLDRSPGSPSNSTSCPAAPR